MTHLKTLYLERNRLTGQIPDLNLASLGAFNVSYNLLNGSVPEGLRRMPASSFLGMPLCGGPLGPCPGEISPAPAPGQALAPGAHSSSSGGGGGGGGGKKLSGGAIAGIAIGSVAATLLVLGLLLLLCRRCGGKGYNAKDAAVAEMALKDKEVVGAPNGYGGYGAARAAPALAPAAAAAAPAPPSGGKKLVFLGPGPRVYDLEDLLRASAEVLGKGTFGTTYKAVLEMGPVVAVKRLKDSNLPEREFRDKIGAVASLDHPNLVPLQAFYFSKDEKLLVYEYVSMGSLSSSLHGNRGSGRTPLDWVARSGIALAAAKAIQYIHSTSPKASHGNIKSSNVLLSGPSEARVSDHGLAHLVGLAAAPTRASGYRAPEVTDLRKISQKADVYSFGVLLMELLTGKAPAHAVLNDEGVDLPRWVQSVVREEWTAEVFDVELLRDQHVEQEMMELLQLALDCAEQYPDKRPTMSEVVVRIEEIRASSLGSGERRRQQNGHETIESADRSSSMISELQAVGF
ncbi:probable inactive receptor kinase RLK902 [Ananas comosus]|uniref:Probable inactive receptor kinase RLK902 n=1 Tax=Ananas comosus TaxID=4615 RepID=A0A6P5H0C3_ANACO|nr:probable inactive receptor kinase RLK902 [Ananas comosus]